MAKNKFAIFCDIGNVLVDAVSLIEDCAKAASFKCAEQGFSINPSAFYFRYLQIDKKTKRAHINHLYGDYHVADETVRSIWGKSDIRYVGSFLTFYRDHLQLKLKPDIEIYNFFKKLSEAKNINLGIISDGTIEQQLATLTRLEIIRFFDPNLIIISEDFGKEKDSSDIYLEALKRSATDPKHTYMIGDDLERDVKIPGELGIRTILFSRYIDQARQAETRFKPNHTFYNFNTMLIELLKLPYDI